MNTLAYHAMLFAREVHKDQKRKYTGDPYVIHLAEVAAIATTVLPNPTIAAIAWLHDCMEDQAVSLHTLEDNFGLHISQCVLALSDLDRTGNRAQRQATSRLRLEHSSTIVQTIKCADLISNTASILTHDPKFAPTYLREKRELLAVMHKANPHLLQLAWEQVKE